MRKAPVLSALFLMVCAPSVAQQKAYESPAGTKFLLYTPPGYSSDPSAFPLLLSLHSKGEVSNDLAELTSKNPEQMPCRLIYLNQWPADLPFVVLTPQLKPDPADPEIQWSADYIDEVVRHVIANFRIDLNRIYVTGISRGGTGVWTYASAYPEKVAAVVALSGRSDLTQACAIRDIPVWAFHGESDNVAPVDYSIDMVNAIRRCQPAGKFKPRLTILYAHNHDGWNDVYNGTSGYKVYEWLLKFRKNDSSNQAPYVNAGKDLRILLRNGPLHIMGDFFDSDGDIATVQWRQTGGPSLMLENPGSALLQIRDLKTGTFGFELVVTDNGGAQSSDELVIEIKNDLVSPAVTQLVLVDGETNMELGLLSEGQVINRKTLGLSEINIKAIANDGTASVVFNVNTNQNTHTQNSPGPYFLKRQTDSPEWEITRGEYVVYATPYPQSGGRGDPGLSQSLKFTVTDSENSGPVVNITSPEEGQVFTAPANVTISANASVADGDIKKVEFYNGSAKLGEDLTSPYSYAWNNVSEGHYRLTAKAIDVNNAWTTASVNIMVASVEMCAGAGTIEHEVWSEVAGTEVSLIPVNEEASFVQDLTMFEGPSNIGDNYGSRIRGYICPPSTGRYTFWVSGNENTELWVSTDKDPRNKVRIAFAAGYTDVREWDKYNTQQSAPVTLVARQRYYIEALQKEGGGADHIAVGWQLPGGGLERPIPGMRLIPFHSSGDSARVAVSFTSPENGQYYSAPALVYISATAAVRDGSILSVGFYNGEARLGEDATVPYTFSWGNVAEGNYRLVVKALASDGTSASDTVNITVRGEASSACAGTGTVLRELWTGIEYQDEAAVPLHSAPDFTSHVAIFEDLSNDGDYYQTRLSGYLCVPASGDYTFWIASNEQSELWLGTDERRSSKRKIAYVSGYTNPREWMKFSSQRSSTIHLVAGQQYYVEALHREGIGSDHMAVGWQLPDGTFERPIPGSRLTPVTLDPSDTATTPSFDKERGTIKTNLQIFPNPVYSGVSEFYISTYTGKDAIDKTVEIIRATGEMIYSEKISCKTNCDSYLVKINRDFSPGIYLVTVTINGRRYSKRLLIR